MKARLQQKYQDEIVPSLKKRFGYTSPMAVPKLTKIIVNMGLGEAVSDSKVLDRAVEELSVITGQKPVITRARKSIAGFKLRAGMSIGCMVTLRKQRMYEFLDRLISIALPRVRDFKGVSSKAFDGRGNYTLGLREQIIFPEINYDKIDKLRGLSISVVTTAKTDEEGYVLLKELGMPFSS
jgi:large subunit ribosomal protein L5